jgi:DNA polymerase (family 10)
MTNNQIADHFSLLAKLMEIHGENSFKAKSYSVASYNIDQLQTELSDMTEEKIFSQHGIGDATGKKILELLKDGKLKLLDDVINKTPPGVMEMLKIKGIGPKKISTIWKEMEIENIGELLYACHENRLMLYKNFGKKTQEKIIKAIEFYEAQKGNFLFAQVEALGQELLAYLQKIFDTNSIKITGEYVRHSEIISTLEYVLAIPSKKIKDILSTYSEFTFDDTNLDADFLRYRYDNKIALKLFFTEQRHLLSTTFHYSGSMDFNDALADRYLKNDTSEAGSEADIFRLLQLHPIPAFLREAASVIDMATKNQIPQVILPSDVKGIIHCHSNWSDGSNTIEQLAQAAIDAGYEYLVMSDHSKTAFYAKGLFEDRIKSQHELINTLNETLKPFKIFKSIESDILNDGNLDYSNDVLSTFDLVIASIHSNLKMTEEKAMRRLLSAIENPYTTILGHMTGRLLLSRKGYPLDHEKIIDACVANKVVIELNAHPRRLDMRWQWLTYALDKGAMISINPDAHSIGEFNNIKYGVLAAQKGLVTKDRNLSSFDLAAFENFLTGNKKA